MHAHIFEDMPQMAKMLRRCNASIINISNRGLDGSLEKMHQVARDMHQRESKLYPFASSFDLTRLEDPDYTNQVIAWLSMAYNEGAVMTKIWKEVGMVVRRKDGSYVLPDDPIFDPVYRYMTARRKPLMAHLADPIDAWLPLNRESLHYGYYAKNPQFHHYGKTNFPSHAAIMAARDHILEKHPRLIVIGAHFGSMEHDLDEVARHLDRYPNFYVESGGRTRDLSRQPREKARNFMIKYQDRILYGVDQTWKPFQAARPPTDAQREAFVKSLERRYRADFAFYAENGPIQYDGRTVEGLALPRSVLEKYFHRNARRLLLEEPVSGR